MVRNRSDYPVAPKDIKYLGMADEDNLQLQGGQSTELWGTQGPAQEEYKVELNSIPSVVSEALKGQVMAQAYSTMG